MSGVRSYYWQQLIFFNIGVNTYKVLKTKTQMWQWENYWRLKKKSTLIGWVQYAEIEIYESGRLKVRKGTRKKTRERYREITIECNLDYSALEGLVAIFYGKLINILNFYYKTESFICISEVMNTLKKCFFCKLLNSQIFEGFMRPLKISIIRV